jgi:hypothetical protein
MSAPVGRAGGQRIAAELRVRQPDIDYPIDDRGPG